MKTLVFIPARGGSKSIHLKNLAPLGRPFEIGKPLLKHVIKLGKYALREGFVDIAVSTDSSAIKAYARFHGLNDEVIIHNRPVELSEDDSNVFDAFKHFWDGMALHLWEVCIFLQPTYPFVEKWHIDACLQCLRTDIDAASAQTIIPVPHDYHQLNQRDLDEDGYTNFTHKSARQENYNKQKKPPRFAFGGVLVFRIEDAIKQETLFPTPSIGVQIPKLPVHDIDTSEDLALANFLLEKGWPL